VVWRDFQRVEEEEGRVCVGDIGCFGCIWRCGRDWSDCGCDCGCNRDRIAKGPASDLLARACSHAAFQACCAHGGRAGIWVLRTVCGSTDGMEAMQKQTANEKQ
jgi:hypothetical protein